MTERRQCQIPFEDEEKPKRLILPTATQEALRELMARMLLQLLEQLEEVEEARDDRQVR